MTRFNALLIAGALAFLWLSAAPAHAQEPAWCAYSGGRNGYENCGYYTLRQCRAAVSGVGGDCRPNPYAPYGTYYGDDYYGRYGEPPRRVRRPWW